MEKQRKLVEKQRKYVDRSVRETSLTNKLLKKSFSFFVFKWVCVYGRGGFFFNLCDGIWFMVVQ